MSIGMRAYTQARASRRSNMRDALRLACTYVDVRTGVRMSSMVPVDVQSSAACMLVFEHACLCMHACACMLFCAHPRLVYEHARLLHVRAGARRCARPLLRLRPSSQGRCIRCARHPQDVVHVLLSLYVHACLCMSRAPSRRGACAVFVCACTSMYVQGTLKT